MSTEIYLSSLGTIALCLCVIGLLRWGRAGHDLDRAREDWRAFNHAVASEVAREQAKLKECNDAVDRVNAGLCPRCLWGRKAKSQFCARCGLPLGTHLDAKA